MKGNEFSDTKKNQCMEVYALVYNDTERSNNKNLSATTFSRDILGATDK